MERVILNKTFLYDRLRASKEKLRSRNEMLEQDKKDLLTR